MKKLKAKKFYNLPKKYYIVTNMSVIILNSIKTGLSTIDIVARHRCH